MERQEEGKWLKVIRASCLSDFSQAETRYMLLSHHDVITLCVYNLGVIVSIRGSIFMYENTVFAND